MKRLQDLGINVAVGHAEENIGDAAVVVVSTAVKPDNPEVVAQKTDKGALLRACMERLSDEHKTIIDLVYYHEMSIAEVSETVGIPQNTVKTRMFYARKKLSEFLMEAGVDRGWP